MTTDDMYHDQNARKSPLPGLMGAQLITVHFRDDHILVVQREDGVFVAVAPICQALGLYAKRQRERIERDAVLSKGGTTIALPLVGRMEDTFCLRLDLVNGWLFTIDEHRVTGEEARQKVLTYKRECVAALFQHFFGRRIGNVSDTQESEAPRVRMITEARQTFGVPAAAQLWLELGLPVVPAMLHAPRHRDLFDVSSINPT